MSSAVVWDIVRRESCFLKKSFGTELTSEPTSATNINSFKYSGLSQKSAVGVGSVKTAKGDKLAIFSNTKGPRVQATHATHSKARARSAVAKLTKYRPDLSRAVLAKYAAMQRGAVATKNITAFPTKKSRRYRALA
eukprot:CAMPEP_0185575660 /NCGR_PEP_ID=MMETSP0434-20130131/6794_1 /TAXON_ID=626734 ORGANISM="Favella taraikaensis, Strain Fe Narragansett Bay" /NCGR_SAMPLE_ID=MMETSP0434 /ASSEMBLY_ACC=CAM_ASM_000379 /LENGTH=135 /DNA_ID=CAMNT_0028192601 /DNA_START=55 /DNA_END=462 /DNA_ORIENTATION=+